MRCAMKKILFINFIFTITFILRAYNAVPGIYFWPELSDSEYGFGYGSTDMGSNNGGDNHNQGDPCENYKYSKSNCSSPKNLYQACPMNAGLYRECRCDTNKFKYNSSNCVYVTSPANANGLLQGSTC